MKALIQREIVIPDPMRVSRYLKIPELGPSILFFSGGSALKETSKKIINYTHNTTHLMTSFDSGGSSAHIRNHFDMISIGDIRNRIMALADQSIKGNPEIYKLFSCRLSSDLSNEELGVILNSFISGEHPLIQNIYNPMRKIIINHLKNFKQKMPTDFDLRGASIGNLILTGGHLFLGNDIDSVIYTFSKLIEARGSVYPITEEGLHLRTTFEDRTQVVGQHLITGKECSPIAKKIASIDLVKSHKSNISVRPQILPKIRRLISRAEVICFSMGSFYSSLIANLIPLGVGKEIQANKAPKIYIMNPSNDPEQYGMKANEAVFTIYRTLKMDFATDVPITDFINIVLVDTAHFRYLPGFDPKELQDIGIQVLDVDLFSSECPKYFCPQKLCQVLVSLV